MPAGERNGNAKLTEIFFRLRQSERHAYRESWGKALRSHWLGFAKPITNRCLMDFHMLFSGFTSGPIKCPSDDSVLGSHFHSAGTGPNSSSSI